MTIDAPKPNHVPSLRALWQEAFGDTEEFLDSFERTAFSPFRCRCVTEHGKVVAALYWFDCSQSGERIAYLYAIATAKAHHGKGLCRALMEDTHRHLEEKGYTGALLVPSNEELFAFYEKVGYRVCSHIGELSCRASADGLIVRQIDPNEYAKLRRSFLPPNGVIQENENLKFLQTQAMFYTGDGFLLAARCEKNTLYGVELLGDTAKAPAIVHALGCTEGKFRFPMNDKPFAMYRPLGNNAPTPPFYFGLPFD